MLLPSRLASTFKSLFKKGSTTSLNLAGMSTPTVHACKCLSRGNSDSASVSAESEQHDHAHMDSKCFHL